MGFGRVELEVWKTATLLQKPYLMQKRLNFDEGIVIYNPVFKEVESPMVQVSAPNIAHLNLYGILEQQRQFFSTGQTKAFDFRLMQLKRLKQALRTYESALVEALYLDLRKPKFEAYIAELVVVEDINYAIKHLRTWMKPQKVAVPPTQLPATATIYAEPLGHVLIIGAWNYPLSLMIGPLVGAIAAGNCAILKPSELAPATARLLAEIMAKTFDPAYITVVEGGVEVSQALLAEKFDHIFFTGGATVGKLVMAAAAQHLTPVTLELGGKSPCIVDADVDLTVTAKRIVWGKFLNAGQTCVAPDYLLVDRQIKPALIEAIATTIREFYGDNPAQSQDYARIVSDRHFTRLTELLQSGNCLIGGTPDPAERYIAPTVLDQVSLDDPVMQAEIFGPILPVIEYDQVEEAIALINRNPKPLALYIFSKNTPFQQRILQATSSGGVCINDTIMHLGVPELPFGGVGHSGMGSYHGKAGFNTFSHYKSVLARSFWLDLPLRYAPYANKLPLLKKILG